ncbi:MAG TPA: hypothetical protein VIK92_02125, partial [Thermaerobacter sp.]
SEASARMWGASYGKGKESGTDYEATRQSTGRIRARHRLPQGPGNPRLRAGDGENHGSSGQQEQPAGGHEDPERGALPEGRAGGTHRRRRQPRQSNP